MFSFGRGIWGIPELNRSRLWERMGQRPAPASWKLFRKWRQTVCKPGSVSGIANLIPIDDHSSGTAVTSRLAQPTRTSARKQTWRLAPPRVPIRSCSRWGLPCQRCYQRCGALLPHPFTLTCTRSCRRFAFCGTFPGVAPAGRYPASCFRGARTFLPCPTSGQRRPSDRLTECV